MSQTIRERGKKVFQAVKETSCQGLEAIARATGMSKSSVPRHQQGIEGCQFLQCLSHKASGKG